MSNQQPKYQLPPNIDRYLATLSKIYAQQSNRLLQEIVVNSQTKVQEAWVYDSWSNAGHAVHLTMPETIFLSAERNRDGVQDQIQQDLNKLHNVQDEFFAQVFLEMDVPQNSDWRTDSGLLLRHGRVVSNDATKRIWESQKFRLFLSHKSEDRKQTAALKSRLQLFGVSCFVAHEDISPTKTWQDEIENALATMDGFVAAMTENFHESYWTDQEVGYALARGVPIIALRLGRDPYGFIAKFQALTCDWSDAAEKIVKALIGDSRMFRAYTQALRNCPNYDGGNTLAKVLPSIGLLSPQQIDDLVTAYNETSELRGSYGFNGSKPIIYGPGLVSHLNRLGTRQFVLGDTGLIRIQTSEDIPF